MTDIAVTCDDPNRDGWRCHVRLVEDGRLVSDHDVTVRRADLERLAPGADDPGDLVRRSFLFLLDREPPSAILRTFDLPVIGRYFPEYDAAIRTDPG
jgi:hypothetical protein